MILPILIISLYAIILWTVNSSANLDNYAKLTRTVIKMLIAWAYACAGFYFFKKKSIDILLHASCTSYFLGSILCLIVRTGFSGFLLYIRSLFLGEYNASNNIMEVHGLTFAAGILVLYYIFYENKEVEHHYRKIILSSLLVFFGLKRIEILALVVTAVSSVILVRHGKNIKYRSTLFTIVFLGISLLFVFIVNSGYLSVLASRFSINTMGRIGYYSYANQYFSFSPTYFGMGYTYFSNLFSKLYESGYRINGNLIANSLHSDVLVYYIENGFCLFVFWIVYTFSIQTRLLQKNVGSLAAESYLLICVYMFILYLTDNTFTYFDTEMLCILVPLVLSEVKRDSLRNR